jgi:hypothetical protein
MESPKKVIFFIQRFDYTVESSSGIMKPTKNFTSYILIQVSYKMILSVNKS